MTWWQKLKNFWNLGKVQKNNEEEEYETVRARNEKGRYVADDPNTPENEAYTKKRKKKKK